MDIVTITVGIAAAIGFVGLAWVGGYELGQAHGIDAERNLADRRVKGVLDELNKLNGLAVRKRRARK